MSKKMTPKITPGSTLEEIRRLTEQRENPMWREVKEFYDALPAPVPIGDYYVERNGRLVPKDRVLDAEQFDTGTKVAREHFFKNHVLLPNNARRFVAWRDLDIAWDILREAKRMPKGDRYGFTTQEDIKTNTRLWIPSEYDEDFNLITSLATNGLHYGLYDIDLPKTDVQFNPAVGEMWVTYNGGRQVVKFNGPIVIYNSTKHCHVYETKPSTLAEYYKTLADIPGEDAKAYRHNVENKGYGTLRVPWVKKSAKEQEEREALDD